MRRLLPLLTAAAIGSVVVPAAVGVLVIGAALRRRGGHRDHAHRAARDR